MGTTMKKQHEKTESTRAKTQNSSNRTLKPLLWFVCNQSGVRCSIRLRYWTCIVQQTLKMPCGDSGSYTNCTNNRQLRTGCFATLSETYFFFYFICSRKTRKTTCFLHQRLLSSLCGSRKCLAASRAQGAQATLRHAVLLDDEGLRLSSRPTPTRSNEANGDVYSYATSIHDSKTLRRMVNLQQLRHVLTLWVCGAVSLIKTLLSGFRRIGWGKSFERFTVDLPPGPKDREKNEKKAGMGGGHATLTGKSHVLLISCVKCWEAWGLPCFHTSIHYRVPL